LSDTTLILLAAGSSSRFELNVKKQWLRTNHTPLWQFVAQNFKNLELFEDIFITSSIDDIESMKLYADFTFIDGGQTRQESLKNALKLVKTEYVLVSDIARSCISEDFLNRIISFKNKADCIVPYLKVSDTIVYDETTIDRDKVKRVQTPQLSKTSSLQQALKTDKEFTDESSAIVANGGTREFILGEENAQKITFIQDLNLLSCLESPSQDTLSGTGFDVHAFDTEGKMFLCGVKIESDYGFKAHSDGDVAIHALIDALLGAAGMGDIGELYPDTDESYAGVDSKKLLTDTVNKLKTHGYEIGNVDLTILAQAPKILPYKEEMRKTLASLLGIRQNFVNIKATTAEKLGFVGRKEGVTVHAVANLTYFNWKNI